MKIDVLDSCTAMRDILTAPLPERPERLRRMLEPVAGMYRYVPGEPDLVALHHMSSGFRVDRDDERVLPALDALRDADAWGRVERALHEGLARQLEATPGIATPDELRVLLVLEHQIRQTEHGFAVCVNNLLEGGGIALPCL